MHICNQDFYCILKVFYAVLCSWCTVTSLFIDIPKLYGKCRTKILCHCMDHHESEDLHKNGSAVSMENESKLSTSLMIKPNCQTKMPTSYFCYLLRQNCVTAINYVAKMFTTEISAAKIFTAKVTHIVGSHNDLQN